MPAAKSASAKSALQKVSRSKLELFTDCQLCFWLDVKKGVKRPPGFPFTLNNAVDYLLKEEFDKHREAKTRHPVMEKYNVDALPFEHENLNKWRHNFTGVQVNHEPSGFLIYGAVDDLWIDPDGKISVVDYKATGANEHKIHDSYRRQMEIYQWLLRGNGLDVSDTGYFVFAKANKADGFGMGDAALAFDLFIEPLVGDDSWVENAIMNAKKVFDLEKAPDASPDCDYCNYRSAAEKVLG